mmetsp:Transcript_27296/g.41267  ORF Transcript_27296/g.41267 Transcript_27296/m.41267 type:complete len:139 (+) Transcript_27296:130-546(+)
MKVVAFFLAALFVLFGSAARPEDAFSKDLMNEALARLDELNPEDRTKAYHTLAEVQEKIESGSKLLGGVKQESIKSVLATMMHPGLAAEVYVAAAQVLKQAAASSPAAKEQLRALKPLVPMLPAGSQSAAKDLLDSLE